MMMEVVVGVGDMKVSNDPEVVLATYSLGSCIGLSIYDPIVRVGGMLHLLLAREITSSSERCFGRIMF